MKKFLDSILKILNIFAAFGIIAITLILFFYKDDLSVYTTGRLYDLGFKVEEIHISELKFVDFKDVIDDLSFSSGDSIFGINLAKNKNKLEKNFWIKNVDIKIQFPNIINIIISENQPEFVWYDKGQYYALNHKGVIMKRISVYELSKFADFIVLQGRNANDSASILLDFIKKDQNIYQYISSASWVGDRRWNIKFVNDLELKLPQKNPHIAWSEFISLDKELDFFSNKFNSVDLRVKDRVFIELDLNYPLNKRLIKEIG